VRGQQAAQQLLILKEETMAITIEDVMGAATHGVLRALDARRAGAQGGGQADATELSAEALVRSGFYVNVHIVAGGMPPGPPWGLNEALNPQPLPPGRAQ
jgi:hypothetical protein